jgi:hypothetical protein
MMAKMSRLAAIFAAMVVLAGTCLQFTACGSEQKAEPPQSTISPASAGTQTPDSRRAWSFHGQRGITAAFTPTDLALYRLLLPQVFDMPQSPLVVVAVVYYYDVASPLVPYHEGYVLLQCQYQGQTGWYVLTMPVDDQTANAGGRALGFPKYIAEEIDLSEKDDGWTGDVTFQGQSVMHVTFTPGATPPTAASSADPGLPVFLLLPPAEGPQVNEVDTDLAGERQTVTTSGTATIEADPDDPWAGLLPAPGTLVWGQLQDMTGDWVLTAKQR